MSPSKNYEKAIGQQSTCSKMRIKLEEKKNEISVTINHLGARLEQTWLRATLMRTFMEGLK